MEPKENQGPDSADRLASAAELALARARLQTDDCPLSSESGPSKDGGLGTTLPPVGVTNSIQNQPPKVPNAVSHKPELLEHQKIYEAESDSLVVAVGYLLGFGFLALCIYLLIRLIHWAWETPLPLFDH